MMAPVFAYGQLRLYLLSLLESGPKHGYELITALSDRFGGTYRPSPGTIYPRLARLEDEGLVQRTEDGRKGTYALTDAGRREVAARRADLAALEEDLAETVRGLAQQVRDEVRGSMSGLRADLAADVSTDLVKAADHVSPATKAERNLVLLTVAQNEKNSLPSYSSEY
ncbi:MAG: helix-turn-helix transcriptional regulator, partial [Cellulomonas sp.]|nr:helix-turn-helix transcriptional regulator [Cellulomonas sp.]